jgi:rubrerythrin
VAETEGFKDAARMFSLIAQVERYHERRYRKLLANVEQGTVFKKDAPTRWKCRNCGHVLKGREAPERCPICDHARSYFEVWYENY